VSGTSSAENTAAPLLYGDYGDLCRVNVHARERANCCRGLQLGKVSVVSVTVRVAAPTAAPQTRRRRRIEASQVAVAFAVNAGRGAHSPSNR